MCELGEQQRHFNGLQSHYRTMASTWLLGTLTGIGLVYSDKVVLPIPPELAVAVLATAASLGIVLLWMLDILVYHELLVANYEAGKDLEREYAWLPQVRDRYSRGHSGAPVRVRASRFYIASAQLLLIIASAATARYASVAPRHGWATIVTVLLTVVAVGGGIAMMWYARLRVAAQKRDSVISISGTGSHSTVHNVLMLTSMSLTVIVLALLSTYRPMAAAIGAIILVGVVVGEALRMINKNSSVPATSEPRFQTQNEQRQLEKRESSGPC